MVQYHSRLILYILFCPQEVTVGYLMKAHDRYLLITNLK